MAIVEFKGLGSQDVNKPGTFTYALSQLVKNGGKLKDVFADIGLTGVQETTKKLLSNRVMPATTQAVLDQRRTGRRRYKGAKVDKGLTLVDTAVGLRQVSYKATSNFVQVGVPRGYMSAHQRGTVPNAPQRMFLMLPNRKYIMKLVMFHIEKAMK